MTSTGVDTRGAQEGQESQEKRPLRAAAVPRRPAGVGFLGMLLALAVAAVGVLGIYEATVLLVDVVDGDPLLTPFLTGPATVDQEVATAVVAGLAVLAGLWLLWTALRPGRRSGVEVGAGTGVWMTYGDLERLASAAAGRCDGVISASATASRRRVRVDAQTTGRDVEGDVRSAVTERLAALAAPPRVDVRVQPKHEGGAR